MNKEQRANLIKGRNFLRDHVTDKQFDMSHYMEDRDGFDIEPDQKAPCGAVGCALGWIAQEPSLKKKIRENWLGDYEEVAKLLGVNTNEAEWDFLFSPKYGSYYYASDDGGIDNTREGAIGRINVLLKYPDLFEGEEQDA